MPLQNRVTPWGGIETTPERGTMMGNRGGKFHQADKTLARRLWASQHWICCELHYKGLHHEPMGDGYTSLFFLDEVTALAAGHRPCFFCRRDEAKRFLGERRVDDFDRELHEERVASPRARKPGDEWGDGVMIEIEGTAYAVKGPLLLRWSHGGYVGAMRRKATLRGRLLTPPMIVRILAAGYKPRWHDSALTGDCA